MARSFPSVPDPNILRRYVESTGENGFVDSKAACAWEGEEVRASLTKDIVAFANSGGGGAIVIGKEALPDGRFNITGVTESQAASFDTTRVGNWINERFDPPVVLTCSSYRAGEQTVVVIEVDEFGEQPSMCTKECGTNRDKWQLKQGAIYVRSRRNFAT
jgi:predicted HTH transcriptional regulator